MFGPGIGDGSPRTGAGRASAWDGRAGQAKPSREGPTLGVRAGRRMLQRHDKRHGPETARAKWNCRDRPAWTTVGAFTSHQGRGMRTRFTLLSASLVATMVLVACSGSGAPTAGSDASSPPSTGGLAVEGAWARPAAAGAETAAYFTVRSESGQPDSLLEASSPDAAVVELHEVTADPSGMMGMHPIDRLDIPGDGAAVELKPGGFHLMVMDLSKELTVGGTLELHLVFAHAGTITVQAEIRQN